MTKKKTREAYKLFRVRKDGTIGSLFINPTARLPLDQWLKAENYPTPGFYERPGWHCCLEPKAPHLTLGGRAWYRVMISDWREEHRPQGVWLIAKNMKIIGEA